MSDQKNLEDDFFEIILDWKVEYVNVKSYQEWEVDFIGRKKEIFDKNAYKNDKNMSQTWNIITKWMLDGTIFEVLDEDIQSPSDFFSKL